MPYDAIIIGNPTFNTPGKFGSGCLGNLSTQNNAAYIACMMGFTEVGSSPGAVRSPYTIEFWFRAPAGFVPQYGIAMPLTGSPGQKFINLNPAEGPFFDGNWHFLSIDSNGNGLVDGAINLNGPNFASALLQVGNYTPDPQHYAWPGEIDELSVWNAIKDGAPPTAPYTGLEDGLIALYHFDGDGKNSCVATMDPVTGSPAIAFNPIPSRVIVGSAASFSSFASGTPAPVVQWQSDDGTQGEVWVNIAGANATTYSATATTTQQYRAVFSNVGGTVVSAPATLTVLPRPAVTWQQQYAGVDREPIWAALKSHFDTKVGELFKIVSRKHIMPPQLAMESQPALFIVQLREERKGSRQGAPNTAALTGWLIIYLPAYLTDDTPGQETSLPATQLNTIFKAIDDALVPDNMNTGKFTLGGLVTHCWVEGETDQDPGLFTNQASAIIPIHILVP